MGRSMGGDSLLYLSPYLSFVFLPKFVGIYTLGLICGNFVSFSFGFCCLLANGETTEVAYFFFLYWMSAILWLGGGIFVFGVLSLV